MKDFEVLAKATDLIRDPLHWTQGTWCRTTAQNVDKFCAEGALLAAMGLTHRAAAGKGWVDRMGWAAGPSTFLTGGREESLQFSRLLELLTNTLNEMHPDAGVRLNDKVALAQVRPIPLTTVALMTFNDQVATHAEVLAVFEKATANLQEKGQ